MYKFQIYKKISNDMSLIYTQLRSLYKNAHTEPQPEQF